MTIYAHDDFEQIAAAIDMEAEEIAKHAKLFEAAARWYRLDRNSPDRVAPSACAGSSIKSRRTLVGC